MDRLSALLTHFDLSVRPTQGPEVNLAVMWCMRTQAGCRILYAPRGRLALPDGPESGSGSGTERAILTATVRWGGEESPLTAALPERLDLDIRDDTELQALTHLLVAEADGQRCGHAAILDNLGEVLMVRLLRRQLEQRAVTTGLLGGLADPRLHRALVALHEAPGKAWRNEDLAHLAGLSLSRFAEVFTATLGETPAAYLRRWRMALARRDLGRGERIQTIAHRYGYASGEAFTRAYQRHWGTTPVQTRQSSPI